LLELLGTYEIGAFFVRFLALPIGQCTPFYA